MGLYALVTRRNNLGHLVAGDQAISRQEALHADTAAAVAHGLRLVAEGADILDIGGESTRPGADTVSVESELARVIPVIEGLRALTEVPISIDTRKAEVMARAAAAGKYGAPPPPIF